LCYVVLRLIFYNSNYDLDVFKRQSNFYFLQCMLKDA
jgi:hypothetical protein